MKRTEVIIIALRLLSTYLLIMGLTALPPTLVSLFAVTVTTEADLGSRLFAISASFYGVVYLVACALVWSFAPRIARLVENDIPHYETYEQEFTVSNVMTIGLVLLGFLVLSWALPSLVKVLIAVLAPSFDTHFPKSLSTFSGEQRSLIPWSDIASMIIQIIFGLWLVLGSQGIASFLRKVRYAGR